MATLLVILLLAIVPGQSFPAQELRRGLEGVAGFRVEVEGMTVQQKALGLSQQEIKADVEQRLRLAGIKVDDELKPYLYIGISVGDVGPCESEARYFASVRIRFRQMVTVGNGNVVDAATWDDDQLYIGPADTVSTGVDELLKESPRNSSMTTLQQIRSVERQHYA